MDWKVLVYGSYGYTGALVARTAVESGYSPTLAGRTTERVERQATELGLDHRAFSLEHRTVVEDQVAEFDAVLNCAGPFSATAGPLASACIATGTDYLDITGEIDVLESLAGRDEEARDAGVTLLPAVGFDVVPTDCLAAHLASRLSSPTRLTLAIDGLDAFSPGTGKSMVEGLSRPAAVREDGEIRTVPAAAETRRLDFGHGAKTAVSIPWGDVATAYYTTGIPNVRTLAAVPEFAVGLLRRTRPLAPLLASSPVQRALKALVDATVSGPTAEERAQDVARVWGEVVDDEGNRAVARLRTPDPYDLTARTAVVATQRLVAGEVPDGFQTPASAFGPDFVLEFEGVEREDVTDGVGAAARHED